MALYHVFSEVENRYTGVPMSGVQVVARFAGVSTVAPIYANDDGTQFDPENYCLTDADGMYSFYINSGEYDLDFMVGSQVIKTVENYRPAEVGPTGPANSTYETTPALELADVGNVSAILSESGKAGTFTIRQYADFTSQVAADSGKVNYIRSTSDTSKVWVRTTILSTGAGQTGASSGLTVDNELAAKATLSGVSRTATDFGTFTGSTIPDNLSSKAAMQALETAVEARVTTAALAAAPGASQVGTFDGRTVQENIDLFGQESTGAFWTAWETVDFDPPPDLGANVQRMNDRLFLGAATDTSGDFPATTKDYYEQYEADSTSEYGFRTSWAQFAAGSTVGGIGVLGFARTSDTAIDIPFQLGVGGWFATINDNLTNPCLATGLYGVAFREPGAGAGLTGVGTVGAEIDICNLGNSVQITPGNLYPSTGFTTCLQLNSGAFVDAATTASAALTIGYNKANYYSGIVIAKNALEGVTFDGGGKVIAGAASAIRINTFQQMEWFTGTYAAPCFTITSQQLTEANSQSIIATDTGIMFGGAAGAGLAFETVYPGGVTGGRVAAIPAYSTNPPTLAVNGATNAHLRLRAAGTGLISFGTYTNTPSAITGYINIVDDGGTVRKLAVIS